MRTFHDEVNSTVLRRACNFPECPRTDSICICLQTWKIPWNPATGARRDLGSARERDTQWPAQKHWDTGTGHRMRIHEEH